MPSELPQAHSGTPVDGSVPIDMWEETPLTELSRLDEHWNAMSAVGASYPSPGDGSHSPQTLTDHVPLRGRLRTESSFGMPISPWEEEVPPPADTAHTKEDENTSATSETLRHSQIGLDTDSQQDNDVFISRLAPPYSPGNMEPQHLPDPEWTDPSSLMPLRNRFRTESMVGMPMSPWSVDTLPWLAAGQLQPNQVSPQMWNMPMQQSWVMPGVGGDGSGMPAQVGRSATQFGAPAQVAALGLGQQPWDQAHHIQIAPLLADPMPNSRGPIPAMRQTQQQQALQQAQFAQTQQRNQQQGQQPTQQYGQHQQHSQRGKQMKQQARQQAAAVQPAAPRTNASKIGGTTGHSGSNSSVGAANPLDGPRTTVMLRNLPDGFTREMLLSLLDSEGFEGCYDFAYLPVDFGTLRSLRHAFVNLLSPEDAERLRQHLDGFKHWKPPCDSVLSVAWNDKQQGLNVLVERYRNSPVMHEAVPDECKPLILEKGRRSHFPPATQKIKPPKSLKGLNRVEIS